VHACLFYACRSFSRIHPEAVRWRSPITMPARHDARARHEPRHATECGAAPYMQQARGAVGYMPFPCRAMPVAFVICFALPSRAAAAASAADAPCLPRVAGRRERSEAMPPRSAAPTRRL